MCANYNIPEAIIPRKSVTFFCTCMKEFPLSQTNLWFAFAASGLGRSLVQKFLKSPSISCSLRHNLSSNIFNFLPIFATIRSRLSGSALICNAKEYLRTSVIGIRHIGHDGLLSKSFDNARDEAFPVSSTLYMSLSRVC